MTNDKNRDIHERIYKFVLRVINLTRTLKNTPQNLILINQVSRSVTSMGANDQEADAAESKRDFIAKYSIVKKEGEEILRIVSKIILNAKRKI